MRSLASVPLYAFVLLAVPVAAQDHSGHQVSPAPAPLPDPARPAPTPTANADPHAGHVMPTTPPAAVPTSAAPAASVDPHAGHVMPSLPAGQIPAPALEDPHAGHQIPAAEPDPMAGMDHNTTDASEDMSGSMAASPGPEIETPPPPEAGSGPPRAADAVWGTDAMRASRHDLQQNHGNFPVSWFQADRAEVRVRDGADGYLWDAQGYYGGPTSRLWMRSEGEGAFGERFERAEFQALYSQAIAPFFDVQAGVRQDIAGPDTTYAVLGIQGLTPYQFETIAAVFFSNDGDLTARLEAELDQRITQRFILQPRAEVNLAAQDVPQLGISAGIDSLEVGIRLRYEIVREFAPYVGIEQVWRLGQSADYARAIGDDPSVMNFVAGICFWF